MGAAAFGGLSQSQRGALLADMRPAFRGNSYNQQTGVLTVTDERADAIARVGQHYARLFSDDPALQPLRIAYAMRENPINDPEHRAKLSAFFFWTAWAAGTERPGETTTYTNNYTNE